MYGMLFATGAHNYRIIRIINNIYNDKIHKRHRRIVIQI